MTIGIEICLDSVDSAESAQRGGATRVELCDNLMEGGTTPSQGMIAETCDRLEIDVMAMIRPRGGDFLYTECEFAVMERNVTMMHQHDLLGVVFGMLLPNGRIDRERTRRLIELARPFQVTFHRAFDMARDPYEALDDLLELGVDRILTSGQELTAMQGLDVIGELQRRAGNAAIIMPAVQVSAENAPHIIRTTGVREIHIGSNAAHQIASGMTWKNPRSSMGDDVDLSEYEVTYISAEKVAAIAAAVHQF